MFHVSPCSFKGPYQLNRNDRGECGAFSKRMESRLSIANDARGSLFVTVYSLTSTLKSSLEMSLSVTKLESCNEVHVNVSPLRWC